jgi:hypothetical protein
MLANVMSNGWLHQSALPVISAAFTTPNQMEFWVKSDVIAAVVIGVIVFGAAVFALMCRYR